VGEQALAHTPFDIVSQVRTPQRTTERMLLDLSAYLEQHATTLRQSQVLMTTFQHERYWTEAMRRRYSLLARDHVFTAVFAINMPTDPVPGVRGTALEPGDPLAKEWNVIVFGPYFAVALVARELEPSQPGTEREFDYILTRDRTLVTTAARALLHRSRPDDLPV
jgi:DICT domain-containing protein